LTPSEREGQNRRTIDDPTELSVKRPRHVVAR